MRGAKLKAALAVAWVRFEPASHRPAGQAACSLPQAFLPTHTSMVYSTSAGTAHEYVDDDASDGDEVCGSTSLAAIRSHQPSCRPSEPACGESVSCLDISLPSMMLCDYVVVLCVHGISLCLTDGLSVVECSSLARTCVQPMLEHSCGCVIVRCCNRSELQSRGRSTIVATAGVSWSWSHERRWSHL